MKWCRFFSILFFLAGGIAAAYSPASAQQPLYLTFDDVIDIAFDRSYDVNKVRQEYLRNLLNTKASRAELKSYSNISMDLPSMAKSINRYAYGSTFVTRDKRTTTFQTTYSINKPFITNGTFSLNADLQTFDQNDKVRTYKNKLFMKFTQPLFTLNRLRNDIWQAEERLKQTENRSIDGLFRQYDSFNRLFYDLYKLNKEYEIDSLIAEISSAAYRESVRQFSEGRIDSSEVIRLEVDYLLSQSRFLKKKVERYRKELEFKQKIGLSLDQPVVLQAELSVEPVDVDIDYAIEKGMTDRPSLQTKEIDVAFREYEIKKAGASSSDRDYITEFKGGVEGTYGIERTDEKFNQMFKEYEKTQSLKFIFSFPLWNSGRKKYRVKSATMNYEKALLELENDRLSRENEIRRALRNVTSSQSRALALQKNQERAKEYYENSLEQFRRNEISARDLSRALEEYRKVQRRYLNAFVDFNRAKIDLSRKSLWDFDNNISMKEKFLKYLQVN